MGNGFSSLHKAVQENDLSALCFELQSNSSQINEQEDEVMAQNGMSYERRLHLTHGCVRRTS